MPFIGLISKVNDCNFIKNEILKNSESFNFEIINLNKKSIENVKNIKFDVLVINEETNELLKNSKYIENIIKKAEYIIINADIENNLLLLKSFNGNIITYGFNAKSTITISSVKEENVMLCIQRKIKGASGNLIEEQEVSIKFRENNMQKLYNILIIFTILSIYGKK